VKGLKKDIKHITILSVLFSFMFSMFCFTSAAYAQVTEPDYHKVITGSGEYSPGEKDMIINPAEVKDASDKTEVLDKTDSFDYGQEALLLNDGASFSFDVNVSRAGSYHIMLDYYIPESSMQDLSLSVSINHEFQFYESRNIKLPSAWKDENQVYKKDKLGNDLYPRPERVFKWQKAVLNQSMYSLSKPLLFKLKQGENTIKLVNNNVKVVIGKIVFLTDFSLPSYAEYKNLFSKTADGRQFFLNIQGESYAEKSHSYIRGSKGNNFNMYPYDAVEKRINSLSGETSYKPGESVTYNVDISKDGMYQLSFKYIQGHKKNMPVFKRISIDGRPPFDELNEYAFHYTGASPGNETLHVKDEKIRIHLSEGKHSITLESTASPFFDTYENLTGIISSISDTALKIKMITGNKVDKDREWGIVEYIPDLKQQLLGSSEVLMREYEKITGLSEKKISMIADLKLAGNRLRYFAENPNDLVNNLDQFSSGSGSISAQIAAILPNLLYQPMDIDCIYITGEGAELPAPKVNFLTAAREGVKKFFASFLKRNENQQTTEEGKINVWVARPLPYIEVLRERVESDFTAKTGIEVNISSMPDEQKLLLAVSSGKAPDLVLGASSYRPFDFALRGALYDLRDFNDFGRYIRDFPSEAFVPFAIGDSCYALPETVNFNVLFYRKDIMEKLNIKIPGTWDETLEILPVLSRYGMDFNTMIANVGGFKHFGATVPFIQQYEGRIYSDDGTRVELGDPKTIEAFKLMTNLYTRYSLPENVANFYSNFRHGVTPIGMSDFNTYILLKNAAPEISEQWGIAPSVGIRNAKGDVLRYQSAVVSSCIMTKNTKMPKEGWEFMKWWMDMDTQVLYANDLQLRFGPEYIWNTANLKAFSASSAVDEKDKKVILDQLRQMKEIPRNPAYFAVERELSSAWNKVVFDGMSPRTALDQAIMTANREIAKKLKEFGYMDSQGKLIKPFVMADSAKIDRWKE
jgi:ABC-type glycerol-3-phosphate transport system substrate-binding protein